ncbi:hypothetical protein Hanom_Chr02g00120241 [Helianthus anomalus]
MELLGAVNQWDCFNNLVTEPLRVALTKRLRSVHEYTLEFYSTFVLNSRCDPFDNDGWKSDVGGPSTRFPLHCFGSIVGLYAEEDAGNEENTGGLREI